MNRKALLMALRGAAREAGIAGGTGVAAGGVTYGVSKAAGASDKDAARNAAAAGVMGAGMRAVGRKISGAGRLASLRAEAKDARRSFERTRSVVDREFAEPSAAMATLRGRPIGALRRMEPADMQEAAAKQRKMDKLRTERDRLKRGG